MKKSFLVLCFLLVFSSIPLTKASAWMIMYKEEYYNLYHVNYAQHPNDCIENIYWLEKAAKADFCNPQFVDFKVTSEKQWEKYRYLFQMHINLKLIEQHMRVARIYDKKEIYFYDAPYKELYKTNLERSLTYYQAGLYYWKEAKLWCEKANVSEFNFLFITEKQAWEDERERIVNGNLDYEKILNREIKRIEKNLEQLNQMDEKY